MNLDDFSTVVDDRRYINPQVALDESNAFIQKLRDTQSSRNEQIQRDTYNLGTAVPSNLGGLGGSQSYFNARYQTPQTNNLVADLKATAQAQALSDVMNNEIAQAKQRYNNAYKAYSKRHGGSGGTTDPTNTKTPPVSGDADMEGDGGDNNFWSGNFDDDVAHYGLYELRRSQFPNDTDAEWKVRAYKWTQQMGAKHRAEQGLDFKSNSSSGLSFSDVWDILTNKK